jgi:hypothetical protein
MEKAEPPAEVAELRLGGHENGLLDAQGLRHDEHGKGAEKLARARPVHGR